VFKRNWIEHLNTLLIRLQVQSVLEKFNIFHPLVLVTLPTFAPLTRYLKATGRLGPVIYYYSDRYECYREIKDPAPIIAWDKMLQEDADAIYCASQTIYDGIPEHIRQSKPVRVVDHQVDFDHFDGSNITPTKLSIQRPIIGYFGSLSDSNDWDMIAYAAVNQPDWQFVFIGKKLIDLPNIEILPNVHFLGFIPYESLPATAINFDVGLMFWRMTDWIRACSPLKLKEYLALGLPVVSVPIDEVVNKYHDYVELAVDGPSLVSAIKSALKRSDSNQRQKFASSFSWKEAVVRICSDLKIS
jgi:glycosyltransferase involved in cell wall biosynthesis